MRSLLASGLLLAMMMSGCSGGDGGGETTTTTPPPTTTSAPPPAPVELSVSTSGTYPVNPGFTPNTLNAKAGAPISLTFNNDETVTVTQHNWVLEGVTGASTSDIGGGESETIAFTAPEAGTYAFYCSIGDHRGRGMQGTMTVTNATA